MDKVNLDEIRKELPAGAFKELAKRVGVAEPTISLFFSGRVSSKKLYEIKIELAKYIKEIRAKQKEADEILLKAIES